MSDSDDEEDEAQAAKDLLMGQKFSKNMAPEGMQYTQSYLPGEVPSCDFSYGQTEDSMFDARQSIFSPSSVHARLMGTDSHTLQLMKANFFSYDDDDYIQDAIIETKQRLVQSIKKKAIVDTFAESDMDSFLKEASAWSQNQQLIHQQKEIEKTKPSPKPVAAPPSDLKSQKALISPIIRPKVAILKFKSGIAPPRTIISVNNRFKCLADMGIQMGKSFRPRWGPQSTLISMSKRPPSPDICLCDTLNSQLGTCPDCNGDDTSYTNVVQRFQILGGGNNDYLQTFKLCIEGHLDIQLTYSEVENHPVCPMVKAMTGVSSVNALHDHTANALQATESVESDVLMKYCSEVWQLCEALWGRLADFETNVPDDSTSHESIMLRKNALSNWLKLTAAQVVQQEIAGMEQQQQADRIIYSLLTGNKLEEACNRASSTGDHCLALLLSQLGGKNNIAQKYITYIHLVVLDFIYIIGVYLII